MTEAEALEKWCPFARVSTHGRQGLAGDSRCIGSDCMAWRPNTYQQVETLAVGMDPHGDGWEKLGDPTEVGLGAGHRQTWSRTVVDPYCGLAGRP